MQKFVISFLYVGAISYTLLSAFNFLIPLFCTFNNGRIIGYGAFQTKLLPISNLRKANIYTITCTKYSSILYRQYMYMYDERQTKTTFAEGSLLTVAIYIV